MKFRKWKRIIAGMMTAVMIATSAPSGAYAAEESDIEGTAAEVLTEGTEETVIETQEAVSAEQAIEETTEEGWKKPKEEQAETKTVVELTEEETESSLQNDSKESDTEENRTEGMESSQPDTLLDTEKQENSASTTETLTEEEMQTETETEEISDTETDVRAASDITRDEAVDWVNKQVGKQLDYDGYYGAQCVDLICYYYKYLGAAVLYGDAKNYATNATPAGWNRIGFNANVKDVQPGDIAVWTGTSTGHVAIVVSVDANGFNVAEQNYAAGADGTFDYGDVPCAIRYHAGYRHYTGGSLLNCVIRPNFKASTPPPEPDGPDLPNGGTRTIMDGDYHIVSALDNTMCLDVDSYQTVNGANVHLCHSIDNPKQVFTVTWLGADKGYKIVCKNSGKCIDIEYGSRKKGANVHQWEYTEGLNQQWVINEVDNGAYYTIQSRCGSHYLDVAEAADCANVYVWEGHSLDNQKWRFVPAQSQTIPNGDYHIVTEVDNGKCLSVENTNVQINSKIGQNDAVFTVTYLNNGFYKIIHKQTGMSMDISRAEAYRGTNVQVIAYDGNFAQQWAIRKASDGTYYIQPRCSGHYLDVANAGTQEGTNVWTYVWTHGGSGAQNWKFVPAKKPKMQPPTAPYPDGAEVEAGTRFYLDTHGADEVYLTWDGTEPTRQSMAYSKFKYSGLAIFTQWKSYTLKAFAVKEGYEDSDIVTYTYKVIPKETEPESEKTEESSKTEESGKTEESSKTEESGKTEESSKTEESGSTEESIPTEESSEDEDPQDGVKWHYSEQKVTYKDLSMHGEIATAIKPKTYDGTPYKPTIKVTTTENGKPVTLTEGTDYRVLYFNNTHAGTATVTVRGNGIYKGTISRKYEIKKKPCKKLKVLADSMPKGTTAAPKVYVYDGATLLKENKDYTLDGITQNLTATKGKKQFYVIAAPDSDYEGTTTAKLTVYDAAGTRIQGTIDNPNAVKLSQSTYPYTGTACKPTAVVTINGKTLTAGKDYTITYQNNKQTGTAFAIITGKGAYAGSVVKEFTIKPSDGEFTLKKPIATPTYNGKLQKPKITVMANGKTLKLNKDYTLTYTNNLHATDHAKVTVRGKGNYKSIPAKTFYFTINPCQNKKATVKGAKGSLTITYAKHTLVEGVDYDLIYGEVVGKNKITVTIRAKEGGSFTGEVTKRVSSL